ncbi:hypothetical protein CGRA01v4_05574 [Colletotrichum graminicola]|nr:hypothetical protein CGRA01v4_05574 [Colletotrichum graminicola]
MRQGRGEGTVGSGEPSKSVGATEGSVGVLPHDIRGRCGIAVSQPARGAEDGESRRQKSRKVGVALTAAASAFGGTDDWRIAVVGDKKGPKSPLTTEKGALARGSVEVHPARKRNGRDDDTITY